MVITCALGFKPRLTQRIPIQPSLEVRVVEAVAVVVETETVDELGGEAVEVNRPGAAGTDEIAEGIVPVQGILSLAGVDEEGDVAVAIGKIVVVGGLP